jgi:uncharacterized protein (TIGR03067 family)
VLAFGLLLAADAQADDAVKKKRENSQDNWTAALIEERGQQVDGAQASQCPETFIGDKYVQKAGGMTVAAGTQKLDPTNKGKTMEITVTDGSTHGQLPLVIQEIEGNTVNIRAAAHGPKDRPKGFATKSGNGVIMLVMMKDKVK